MEKKYKLFTSAKCAPCIRVKNHLDRGFKDWESRVEIIDVTEISREDWDRMKEKYNIKYTPTLLDVENNNIVFWGYNPYAINDFIKSVSKQGNEVMKNIKSSAEKVGDATFKMNFKHH